MVMEPWELQRIATILPVISFVDGCVHIFPVIDYATYASILPHSFPFDNTDHTSSLLFRVSTLILIH